MVRDSRHTILLIHIIIPFSLPSIRLSIPPPLITHTHTRVRTHTCTHVHTHTHTHTQGMYSVFSTDYQSSIIVCMTTRRGGGSKT